MMLAGVVGLALGGCGGGGAGDADDGARTQPPPASEQPAGDGSARTDGRLGSAVVAQAGQDEELLSEGGPIPPDTGEETPGDAGVGEGASCPGADLAPAQRNLRRVISATRCLMNAERRKRGLPPLTANAILARASRAHSKDMVRQGYFDHRTRSGRTVVDRLRKAGYFRGSGRWTVGENLAWGSGALASPRAIVRGWMNSPPHRRNLLSPRFSRVGLGIVVGIPQPNPGEAGATFTTNFG